MVLRIAFGSFSSCRPIDRAVRTAVRSTVCLAMLKRVLRSWEKQSLPVSGEQHEVGLPMPHLSAAFGLGGTFADRAAALDKAGRTAASTSAPPSFDFVPRQQAMPVILLGRSMIDKTID